MTEDVPKLGRRDWAEEAKNMLRAELKRRGMTYKDLVEALEMVGVQETEANLRNKVSRGNFSASFFLQTLDAMGCTLVPAVPAGMTALRGRGRVGSSLFRQRVKEHEEANDGDEADGDQSA